MAAYKESAAFENFARAVLVDLLKCVISQHALDLVTRDAVTKANDASPKPVTLQAGIVSFNRANLFVGLFDWIENSTHSARCLSRYRVGESKIWDWPFKNNLCLGEAVQHTLSHTLDSFQSTFGEERGARAASSDLRKPSGNRDLHDLNALVDCDSKILRKRSCFNLNRAVATCAGDAPLDRAARFACYRLLNVFE